MPRWKEKLGTPLKRWVTSNRQFSLLRSLEDGQLVIRPTPPSNAYGDQLSRFEWYLCPNGEFSSNRYINVERGIDVVIPVFGAADALERCLASVFVTPACRRTV